MAEPKVIKIEGEAFKRIFEIKKKQRAAFELAMEADKEFQAALIKEDGIEKSVNPYRFDSQYESTGIYFLREEPLPSVLQDIIRAAMNGEPCPACDEVHSTKDDAVTKH